MTYPLLILSLLIWPFGQLLNFSLPNLPFTLYPLDLLCALLTLSLSLSAPKRAAIVKDPLFKPLAYFLLAATISLGLNLPSVFSVDFSFSLFYLARLFIYPAVYFSVKLSKPQKILPYTLLSLTVFALFGLIQYVFFPDMRFLKLIGFDDHLYRLIGPLYDPNFSGLLFAGASLSFISLGSWLPALPLVLLLAFTFSRASYLVFSLGLIYLLIVKRKWIYLFYLVLLITLLFLLPKPFGEGVNLFRTFSIFSRFDSWQASLSLFLSKPLFGWGYNTLRSLHGDRFQIDNSFLYLAATTGLTGLLTFLNLLKRVFKSSRPQTQKIFLLTVLVHSLFNNSLFYIWIYFAFWLVLGLPFKGYKES